MTGGGDVTTSPGRGKAAGGGVERADKWDEETEKGRQFYGRKGGEARACLAPNRRRPEVLSTNSAGSVSSSSIITQNNIAMTAVRVRIRYTRLGNDRENNRPAKSTWIFSGDERRKKSALKRPYNIVFAAAIVIAQNPVGTHIDVNGRTFHGILYPNNNAWYDFAGFSCWTISYRLIIRSPRSLPLNILGTFQRSGRIKTVLGSFHLSRNTLFCF